MSIIIIRRERIRDTSVWARVSKHTFQIVLSMSPTTKYRERHARVFRKGGRELHFHSPVQREEIATFKVGGRNMAFCPRLEGG